MFNLYDRSHDTRHSGSQRQTPDSRLIFIITASPVLASAVGDYFRGIDGELTVIWLTSADRACNRLGLDQAMRIILDDVGPSTQEDVRALKAAAPEAKIMLLAGGRETEADDSLAAATEAEGLATPETPAFLRLNRSTENQALAGHLSGLG
jgi:putative intracellular protease/amidase